MEFEKGRSYEIRKYPGDKIFRGIYLGDVQREHLFRTDSQDYAIVGDHEAEVVNGIISHKKHFSSSISIGSRNKLPERFSKLLEVKL